MDFTFILKMTSVCLNFIIVLVVVHKTDTNYFSFTALINLPRRIVFSIFVQPVRFPTNCFTQTDVDVIAVGHGKTGDKSDVSLRLKYAHLKVIPLTDCARLYPDKIVSGSYICAKSSTNDNQSVCGGDSGGPLITKSDKRLIGISAFVTISKIHSSTQYVFFANIFLMTLNPLHTH